MLIRCCREVFSLKCDHVVVLVVDADPDARLPAGLRAVQARAPGILGQVAPDADGGVPVRQGKSEVALDGRVIDAMCLQQATCPTYIIDVKHSYVLIYIHLEL